MVIESGINSKIHDREVVDGLNDTDSSYTPRKMNIYSPGIDIGSPISKLFYAKVIKKRDT